MTKLSPLFTWDGILSGMYSAPKQKSGLVWIISGSFLLIYAALGLLQVNIPGLEQLVALIQRTEGTYIYLAAFLAILFEGLYVVGNFIPGSTFILLIAIFAQTGGTATFLATILAIFCGWSLAGAINIFIAARFTSPAALENTVTGPINDRVLTTWYPAFRANYEVSQVVSGIAPWKVFWSSLRVKVWACLAASVYALILPYFIAIEELDNQEGFLSVLVVAVICLSVGIWQMRKK